MIDTLKSPKSLISFGVFVLAFAVYAFTLQPDLGFTDSGELAGVCVTFGVAHPTGYPLFTVLGHLWSLLPLPMTMIAKMNLFSAFCMAVGVAISVLLFHELIVFLGQPTRLKEKKKHGSLATPAVLPEIAMLTISAGMALTLGFGATMWDLATSIEVYSLQFALLATALLLCLKAVGPKSAPSKFLLASLAIGLCFDNHLTTVMLMPSVVTLFFYRPNESLNISSQRWREFAIVLIPIGLCAAFYLLLVLRSASEPVFNWGEVHRSFAKFKYHVTGGQYSVWMFGEEGTFATNAKDFFSSLLWKNSGFLGFPFALYGVLVLFKRSKPLALFFSLAGLSCLLYSFNYSIHDIDSYYLLFYLAFGALAVVGIAELSRKSQVATFVFLALAVASLVLNFSVGDKRHDSAVPEYIKLVEPHLPKNALVLSSQWDYFVSGFWYKQKVEGLRPDICLLDKELVRRTWYIPQARRWNPDVFVGCEKELRKYSQLLDYFEENSDEFTNPENVNGARLSAEIQAAWESLFKSIVRENSKKRPIVVSLDVLQSEPYLSKGMQVVPQGLFVRLTSDTSTAVLRGQLIDVQNFKRSLSGKSGHLYEGIRETVRISLSASADYAKQTNQQDQMVLFRQKAESLESEIQ